MNDIELGDKVKCIYTGFTGIVVAKTEFINGCVQYAVAPKVKTADKYPEEMSIDEDSLKVISKKQRIQPKKEEIPFSFTGGPSRPNKKMKGF